MLAYNLLEEVRWGASGRLRLFLLLLLVLRLLMRRATVLCHGSIEIQRKEGSREESKEESR
jgi:hypothetical protein